MGANDAGKLASNLREAGKASRTLTLEVAGMSSGLGRAAGEAGILATTIAEIAGGEKMAEMATGIGIVVAAIGTAIAAFISWKEEGKEVAEKIRQVNAETAKLNAAAAGDTRLEKQIAINDTLGDEVFQLDKMEHFYRKFPGLMDAIFAKAEAARRAAKAEIDKNFDKDRHSLLPHFNDPFSTGSDALRDFSQAQLDAKYARDEQLHELERNEKGYSANQVAELKALIIQNYENALTQAQFDFGARARELGESIGRSIASGIADGIALGIKDRSFGDGFKAITGSILVGLGDMMVEIGTHSLLAAQLLAKIIASLQAFAPEGAIGPALLLIAAGGVLKGLGASMQGSGSSRSVGGGGVRGAVVGSMIAVTPSASAAGSLAAIRPITNHFTVIGEGDPVAQRQIVSMVQRGMARAG